MNGEMLNMAATHQYETQKTCHGVYDDWTIRRHGGDAVLSPRNALRRSFLACAVSPLSYYATSQLLQRRVNLIELQQHTASSRDPLFAYMTESTAITLFPPLPCRPPQRHRSPLRRPERRSAPPRTSHSPFNTLLGAYCDA